jgi:hypothetical protein
MKGVNPLAKKLLILGSSFVVAAPVFLVSLSFAYGLVQAFQVHAAVAGNHAVDPSRMAVKELGWLFPVSIFCGIMIFTGFVLLAVGLVRYFVSLAHRQVST